MKTKIAGYIVCDTAEEWHIPCALVHPEGAPPEGVLEGYGDPNRPHLFASRKECHAAIKRTALYRELWKREGYHPTRDRCEIIPVVTTVL